MLHHFIQSARASLWRNYIFQRQLNEVGGTFVLVVAKRRVTISNWTIFILGGDIKNVDGFQTYQGAHTPKNQMPFSTVFIWTYQTNLVEWKWKPYLELSSIRGILRDISHLSNTMYYLKTSGFEWTEHLFLIFFFFFFFWIMWNHLWTQLKLNRSRTDWPPCFGTKRNVCGKRTSSERISRQNDLAVRAAIVVVLSTTSKNFPRMKSISQLSASHFLCEALREILGYGGGCHYCRVMFNAFSVRCVGLYLHTGHCTGVCNNEQGSPFLSCLCLFSIHVQMRSMSPKLICLHGSSERPSLP